ncbi:MAG: hypothetical protein RI897_3141 [Verrucomicrobiota bacterium]
MGVRSGCWCWRAVRTRWREVMAPRETGWGELSILGAVDPFSVFADEVDQSIDSFCFGNIEFHWGFSDVEVDFPGGTSDVAEVGIGHFAGAIDDAAHDGDFDSFEVVGACFDVGGDGLEVEESSAAAGAGDVIGFEATAAAGLEDIVGESEGGSGGGFSAEEDGISDAIGEEGSYGDRGADHGAEVIGCILAVMELVFEEDGVIAAEVLEACSEEPECGDGGERGVVGNRDQLGFTGDFEGGGRIDFEDIEIFVDGFGSYVIGGS